MILTDREIKIAIDKGLIIVEPPPEPEAYSSTALDLTLDPVLRKYKEVGGINLDPEAEDYSYETIKEVLTDKIDNEGTFPLGPGKLILGWTREYVRLIETSKLAARIEGKSSLARIGLAIHLTAPTIHAGFRGSLQMEIVNHGPAPIVLRPGMRICQLIFEMTLGTPAKGYSGQFAEQKAE